tara:strand:+ start:477 stop:1004 length:528 start_codon:yes stop_codon:yes gene_type:complete
MSFFLDSLGVLFILFIGYSGFKRGFIEELGGLIGLVFSIIIAMSNCADLTIKINKIILFDHWFSVFFSFSLLFSIAILFFRILTRLVQIALLSKYNLIMNRSIGFVFASIKGCIILMIFFWFIEILPLAKWELIIYQNSRLAGLSQRSRIKIIQFFNWEDPISLSESYIKNITQP